MILSESIVECSLVDPHKSFEGWIRSWIRLLIRKMRRPIGQGESWENHKLTPKDPKVLRGLGE
jgi:hypothetical protein